MRSRIHLFGVCFSFSLVLLVLPWGVRSADASLTIYYDPGTGNVAFDTASTPTGRMTTYQFSASSNIFLPENHIRISDAVGYSSEPDWISDRGRPGEVLTGYFSIGNVFPAGMSEDVYRNDYIPQIATYESDISGIPNGELPTSFIGGGGFFWEYGQPDRAYDNYWETIDLDTLNWAESAVIGYDGWTGELWLDTTGPGSGYLSTFHLVANKPVFDPDAFVVPFDTPLTLATETSIAAAAGYPVKPGVYSLGRILEPGLSADDLAGMFEVSRFLGQAGVEGSGFDFAGNELPLGLRYYRALPEPGAAVMVGLAAWGLLRRRA
ncbi:MAG: hypothetical protein AAF328_00875 [Planctomycetota bacterium]